MLQDIENMRQSIKQRLDAIDRQRDKLSDEEKELALQLKAIDNLVSLAIDATDLLVE